MQDTARVGAHQAARAEGMWLQFGDLLCALHTPSPGRWSTPRLTQRGVCQRSPSRWQHLNFPRQAPRCLVTALPGWKGPSWGELRLLRAYGWVLWEREGQQGSRSPRLRQGAAPRVLRCCRRPSGGTRPRGCCCSQIPLSAP